MRRRYANNLALYAMGLVRVQRNDIIVPVRRLKVLRRTRPRRKCLHVLPKRRVSRRMQAYWSARVKMIRWASKIMRTKLRGVRRATNRPVKFK